MDEVRNWILATAGVVTIFKHIYDIWQNESKKEARKEKALPPGKQEALNIVSERRGEIPLLSNSLYHVHKL